MKVAEQWKYLQGCGIQCKDSKLISSPPEIVCEALNLEL
jgi:hypothetical protein